MRLYAVILCLAIHASIQTSAQTPADSCGMVASTDSAATYVVDNTLATDLITTPAPQKKNTVFQEGGERISLSIREVLRSGHLLY